MKSRRRHIPFGEKVDPSAFDYTLLNHLYIHEDGNDVIDFAGFSTTQESAHEVRSLLQNRSFAPNSNAERTASGAKRPAAAGTGVVGTALLHLQGDAPQEGDVPVAAVKGGAHKSRLVSVEDTEAHIWLVTQASEEHPPYARMFASPESLFAYIDERGFELPVKGQRRKLPRSQSRTEASPTSRGPDTAFPVPQSRRDQGPLPITKWVDVQADPADPNTNNLVRKLLSRFPIDDATMDNCLYLSPHDFIDSTHLSSRTASYAFVMLTCTPLTGLDFSTAKDGKIKKSSHLSAGQRLRRRFGGRKRNPAINEDGHAPVPGEERASAAAEPYGPNDCAMADRACNAKGVMEMRFEAVRLNLPRAAVPDPVPVAVIAFADWIITVHEKPFAEMDDLLRTIQMHCSPQSLLKRAQSTVSHHNLQPQRTLTTACVFGNLLQISIGHHLDSVDLAQAVDENGDVVFDIRTSDKEQDHVLRHITAIRRCFGECGADVTRRESIVTALLQPNLAHNFLVRDPVTREQLTNAQAHMRYVQHELNDCRDTVAVANWYHNVALQWALLRRGNRALRQLLQLSEMANIMYPVIAIQTLYSVNVPVPFDVGGDPPSTTLVPFFVILAAILLYALLCSRAVYRIFKRKPFETKLLA